MQGTARALPSPAVSQNFSQPLFVSLIQITAECRPVLCTAPLEPGLVLKPIMEQRGERMRSMNQFSQRLFFPWNGILKIPLDSVPPHRKWQGI